MSGWKAFRQRGEQKYLQEVAIGEPSDWMPTIFAEGCFNQWRPGLTEAALN